MSQDGTLVFYRAAPASRTFRGTYFACVCLCMCVCDGCVMMIFACVCLCICVMVYGDVLYPVSGGGRVQTAQSLVALSVYLARPDAGLVLNTPPNKTQGSRIPHGSRVVPLRRPMEDRLPRQPSSTRLVHPHHGLDGALPRRMEAPKHRDRVSLGGGRRRGRRNHARLCGQGVCVFLGLGYVRVVGWEVVLVFKNFPFISPCFIFV